LKEKRSRKDIDEFFSLTLLQRSAVKEKRMGENMSWIIKSSLSVVSIHRIVYKQWIARNEEHLADYDRKMLRIGRSYLKLNEPSKKWLATVRGQYNIEFFR